MVSEREDDDSASFRPIIHREWKSSDQNAPTPSRCRRSCLREFKGQTNCSFYSLSEPAPEVAIGLCVVADLIEELDTRCRYEACTVHPVRRRASARTSSAGTVST